MGRMLQHLGDDPAAGMLGYQQWVGRTTMMLSYWESPEHLRKFAADRDAPHLEPWRRFMKELAGTGNVGVWHETYQVPAAGIEVIYSGMPLFGLAKATKHVQVGAGTNTAKQRMGRAAHPAGGS